ncbi:MAG: hypothetical protein MI922_14885 [Bacteroidales bacterium]|nr:hypothetical protein [Bacteroidales bacterium]
MNSTAKNSTKQLLPTEIYGFAYECPCGERAENCPLIPIDDYSFKEKLNLIKQLNISQIRKIITYHKHCIKRRDMKILSNAQRYDSSIPIKEENV